MLSPFLHEPYGLESVVLLELKFLGPIATSPESAPPETLYAASLITKIRQTCDSVWQQIL
jgi:hypothetical protein